MESAIVNIQIISTARTTKFVGHDNVHQINDI